MRIPISWLNELLTKPLEPKVIEETLTRVGLEIESLEHFAPGLETVVVGQIVQIEPHPNADKLRICQTDIGKGEWLQIVTGAANVQLNDKIPVALVGSVLPGNKPINEAKLRGVESFGMYCSTVELGLPPDVDGVHVLPADTPVGMPIADAMGIGELVLDIAVTANRPDALSVLGVARELAVALPEVGLKAPEPDQMVMNGVGPVKLGAVDFDRCPFYAGLNVGRVKIAPSPEWLVKRLEAAGMRAINNVVDATNYIMLLTGQPLHAFDAKKIAGGEIRVRQASAGETLVTLDDQKRTLSPDDLVIADAEKALVVAGIMGGADAEVDGETQDLFLEAAYFKPTGVRMTGRRLGLGTESSYRFERGVDPEATLVALELCRDLILELAGGTVIGGVVEARLQGFPLKHQLTFRLDQIERILGVSIPNQEVERLLAALGFTFARHTDGVFELNSYDVTVPGWRFHDVRREADIVEELGRHYGFDRIPATLPPVVTQPARPAIEAVERLARRAAVASGLYEVMTPSLTSPEKEQLAGLAAPDAVRVANPLKEMPILRTSLLPNLLEVLRHNRYQGQAVGGVFEIGRTYRLDGQGQSHETLRIAGAVMNSVWEGMWLPEHTPAPLKADFFYAKGQLETIFEGLGLAGGLSFKAVEDMPSLHPGRTAEVSWNGQVVGHVGEVHPRVVEAYDLPPGASVSAWTLDLSAFAAGAAYTPAFKGFSRQPATLRDLAVLTPQDVPADRVLQAIVEAGGDLLERASLFDRYAGEQVPEGQVSLGFSLVYRAPDRTLSVEDVEPAQQRILARLQEAFGAVLRA